MMENPPPTCDGSEEISSGVLRNNLMDFKGTEQCLMKKFNLHDISCDAPSYDCILNQSPYNVTVNKKMLMVSLKGICGQA